MIQSERPTLTDGDFPMAVRGKRVYANLRVKSILDASDEAMAREIARQLNQANEFVTIGRMD